MSDPVAQAEKVDLGPYLRPAPLVLVISGPSGAGKDVTINRLRQLGHSFRFVVTATTRPPRPAEVNGQDYFFVSHCEFERMIVAGELLEHARVYGEYKGIPKSQVREALASGFDVVLRVDVQGAEQLRELMPGAVSIFLAAPSEQELVERLRSRKTETAEAFRQRVATAQREMQEIHHFDYVVINRDGELDCTVERIMAIITAEKSRAIPRKVEL